jgi:Ca-activated chloride channel homolog
MLLVPQFAKNKADVIDAIQLLSANGGATNISAGLLRAYEQAVQQYLPNGNNQLMLVTDGIFNLKATDEQLILKHKDILFTTVVVGNDEEVDKAITPIVQKAGGQLLHLLNESSDLDILLQNVRANARIKK